MTIHMAFAFPSASLATHVWTKRPPNAVRAVATCVREVLLTVDRKDKVNPSHVLDNPEKQETNAEWQTFQGALEAIKVHAVNELAKHCRDDEPPQGRIELMTLDKLREIGWRSFGVPERDDAWRQHMFKNALMYTFASAAATTEYLLHIDDDWELAVGMHSSFVEKSVSAFQVHPHLVVSCHCHCTVVPVRHDSMLHRLNFGWIALHASIVLNNCWYV